MLQLAQYILGGLLQGAIYGLLAVGFSLIYRVTSAINLAQGAFCILGALLTAAIQVEFTGGDSAEVFDLACAALHVVESHPRARDASLLHGAIEGGRALLTCDDAPGMPMSSPIRRRGVELLICVLAHLATPALPIHGIDRVGWDDPAPFV